MQRASLHWSMTNSNAQQSRQASIAVHAAAPACLPKKCPSFAGYLEGLHEVSASLPEKQAATLLLHLRVPRCPQPPAGHKKLCIICHIECYHCFYLYSTAGQDRKSSLDCSLSLPFRVCILNKKDIFPCLANLSNICFQAWRIPRSVSPAHNLWSCLIV